MFRLCRVCISELCTTRAISARGLGYPPSAGFVNIYRNSRYSRQDQQRDVEWNELVTLQNYFLVITCLQLEELLSPQRRFTLLLFEFQSSKLSFLVH